MSLSNLHLLPLLDLVRCCAEDREDVVFWSEFLRRFESRIRLFIRGSIRIALGHSHSSYDSRALEGIQESDLVQNTVMRLVENDCAALKRFSGNSEAEFHAYLAVISRSVVQDQMRRNRAQKRPVTLRWISSSDLESLTRGHRAGLADQDRMDRAILMRELEKLSADIIQNQSGADSLRDRLVFDLYFRQELSAKEISGCQGVNLSKAGVEKLLNRLKERLKSAASPGSSEAVLQ